MDHGRLPLPCIEQIILVMGNLECQSLLPTEQKPLCQFVWSHQFGQNSKLLKPAKTPITQIRAKNKKLTLFTFNNLR